LAASIIFSLALRNCQKPALLQMMIVIKAAKVATMRLVTRLEKIFK